MVKINNDNTINSNYYPVVHMIFCADGYLLLTDREIDNFKKLKKSLIVLYLCLWESRREIIFINTSKFIKGERKLIKAIIKLFCNAFLIIIV